MSVTKQLQKISQCNIFPILKTCKLPVDDWSNVDPWVELPGFWLPSNGVLSVGTSLPFSFSESLSVSSALRPGITRRLQQGQVFLRLVSHGSIHLQWKARTKYISYKI